MHINTSYIEIEVMFKNKYTKLKPFAVLRAVGSVYSVFSSYCIPFSVSSTLRNVLLDYQPSVRIQHVGSEGGNLRFFVLSFYIFWKHKRGSKY